MKWYVIEGGFKAQKIVEKDDIGQDAYYIIFACDCKNRCPINHFVHKAHIGSSYFRTREEAEQKMQEMDRPKLLNLLIADYSHPWPNEDEATKEHREKMLAGIKKFL